MSKLQNRHIWQIHNSDVTVISVLYTRWGRDGKTASKKKIVNLCANPKVISIRKSEVIIRSSQTGQHEKSIKYSCVLQTKMSRVRVALMSVSSNWSAGCGQSMQRWGWTQPGMDSNGLCRGEGGEREKKKSYTPNEHARSHLMDYFLLPLQRYPFREKKQPYMTTLQQLGASGLQVWKQPHTAD